MFWESLVWRYLLYFVPSKSSSGFRQRLQMVWPYACFTAASAPPSLVKRPKTPCLCTSMQPIALFILNPVLAASSFRHHYTALGVFKEFFITWSSAWLDKIGERTKPCLTPLSTLNSSDGNCTMCQMRKVIFFSMRWIMESST